MKRRKFLKHCRAIAIGAVYARAALANGAVTDRSRRILIVGAGAAGLMAGYELKQLGYDFQILEASSTFGGRVRQAVDFADFPLDLGAEWIHSDEPDEFFEELVGDETFELEEDLVEYDPTEYEWEKKKLNKLPSESDVEYKFKGSTWYSFFERYIVPDIADHIVFDSPVTHVNYSDPKVVMKTKGDKRFESDLALITVPISVLQANLIAFEPELPRKKKRAIATNPFPPGLKAFFRFSERFYPDAVSVEDRYYYDAAFGKKSKHHVLALFALGSSAEHLTDLKDDAAIAKAILLELDSVFDGKASRHYIKHIVQNWSSEPYIRGSYSHNNSHRRRRQILKPLNNKVYFAGEALNEEFHSTVDGAAVSGLSVLENMLSQ